MLSIKKPSPTVFNDRNIKRKDKKSQEIYLIVLGERGVGKSTSLSAMYACSQTNQEWKLSEADRFTQNSIVFQVNNYIATTGAYPAPTMNADKFSFWVQVRCWWGWDTVTQLSLKDLPGEWCSFHNSTFKRELLLASGCLVYISGEELFQISERAQLEEILQPIKKLAQMLTDAKLSKKVAIVITKSDCFSDFFNDQQYYDETNILNRAKKRIKEIFNSKSNRSSKIDYRIFESATTVEKEGNRFVLKNSSCLNTLAWLGQFQALKTSVFPKRLSKKLLIGFAICNLSIMSGVVGFKYFLPNQVNKPIQQERQEAEGRRQEGLIF